MADLSDLNMASGRDPEAVFEAVQHRGLALRRRKHALVTGSALAVALMLAIPVASALGPDGPQRLNVADQGDTATTTTAPDTPPAETTTTTTTTTEPGPQQPTTTPSTTAKPKAPPATTTTTAPEYRRCENSEVAATVRTDRAEYAATQPVVATATVRNTSSEPCYFPEEYRYIAVYNEAGEEVMSMSVESLQDSSYQPDPLQPGAERTYNWTWDQSDCRDHVYPCKRAAAGKYAVEFGWGSWPNVLRAKSPLFTLT